MDVVLQLPFDFPRTPTTRLVTESYDFHLDRPSSESLLVVVFGVQLFRYSGQAMVPFLTSAGPVCLEFDEGSTCRRLLDQVSKKGAQTFKVSENIAAVTWLEADQDGRGVSDQSGVDLHLVVRASSKGLDARFIFNSSLFARKSIERFAGHLELLLEAAGKSLDQAVSKLPLLTARERDWVEQMNRGRLRTLPSEPIHRRIELVAAATPERVAVTYRDRSMSYRELNERANRLARHLAANGIGAESRVVVCLEPSFDIVVSLLGVLKAGAVYVPLDPTYPPARILTIMEDTQPSLIISRDRPLPDLSSLSSADLGTPIDPNQTAYIYYTSGTTGKPKGVMASHSNLITYIQVAQERYAFNAQDVMPAIARFSFSISMFELMSPLVAGGQLVILDRDHVVDLPRMTKTLSQVTFFHAGPSLLKNLLAYIKQNVRDFGVFSKVRHASSGGDMIAPSVLELLKEIFREAEVFVIYGCSEISCMGCTYPVLRGHTVTKTYVGRPFDNVVVRVLDGARNLVPIGVVGEIHFAGGGVVKGYLNRPELTNEKFVEIEGQRFYRTGDMGKLSEDGWLEILGRNDFQIKLRGMRIEMAEVEHNLRAAPGVRDGVVMVKSVASAEKALVAYVVCDQASDVNDKSASRARMAVVRRHMAENLPDYMIPAVYVELAALPLNHNMKLDRNALPDPERADQREAGHPQLREPNTPTELKLAFIWKRLLRLQNVGLDDCFFELGGDSLLAMEFIVAVEAELGALLDGMEVLRESLEILAGLCDRRLGKEVKRLDRPQASTVDDFDTFFFGQKSELFGVLHQPREGTRSTRAVLICPPVGQENVRTHFVLKRLARQLAARGIPTFRFDYYGCADSLGESQDASLSRWQEDVVEAYEELKRKSGASQISAIGVRLGAAVLWEAAKNISLSQMIAWDPVVDGSAFYAEMCELHRKYLKGTQHLRLGRSPKTRAGVEELVGMTYSSSSIKELRALRTEGASPQSPRASWLISTKTEEQRDSFRKIFGSDSNNTCVALDFNAAWDEIGQIEDIIPDVGIARALSGFVGAMS